MARRDIEIMLGDKVYLETWVKVKKNWRDKKLDLADFGYNEKECEDDLTGTKSNVGEGEENGFRIHLVSFYYFR